MVFSTAIFCLFTLSLNFFSPFLTTVSLAPPSSLPTPRSSSNLVPISLPPFPYVLVKNHPSTISLIFPRAISHSQTLWWASHFGLPSSYALPHHPICFSRQIHLPHHSSFSWMAPLLSPPTHSCFHFVHITSILPVPLLFPVPTLWAHFSQHRSSQSRNSSTSSP